MACNLLGIAGIGKYFTSLRASLFSRTADAITVLAPKLASCPTAGQLAFSSCRPAQLPRMVRGRLAASAGQLGDRQLASAGLLVFWCAGGPAASADLLVWPAGSWQEAARWLAGGWAGLASRLAGPLRESNVGNLLNTSRRTITRNNRRMGLW